MNLTNAEHIRRYKNRKSSVKTWAVYFSQGFALIKARNKAIAKRKFEKEQGRVKVTKVELSCLSTPIPKV